MSTPTADTLYFFKKRRIEIIVQPLPTPSSNNEIFLSFILKKFLIVNSTSNSVSGLGSRTFLLTINSFEKNSLIPKIFDTGFPSVLSIKLCKIELFCFDEIFSF